MINYYNSQLLSPYLSTSSITTKIKSIYLSKKLITSSDNGELVKLKNDIKQPNNNVFFNKK